MNSKDISVINFEKHNIPQPYESQENNDNKPVYYGTDNLYPNFLLKIYNECGTHASIIENKANYITGDGLKYEDGSDVSVKLNASDNVKELLGKVIKDYLIFNFFAIEVTYSIDGTPSEMHHIPAHKIRTNNSKTKFWFSEDWRYNKKAIVYDGWSLKKDDSTSKIFFFDGYFPSVDNVYTRPEYFPAITSISTDIAIKQFNLNNIKNHFSVSNIITFFMGSNVPEEVKQTIVKEIKESYTGENGKKFIIDFKLKGDEAADIKNLSPGDWDKAYAEISLKVVDDILFSHQVTSPMLFGIKQAGQLGGSTELETAFHIFQATYVRVKRDALESALNLLFSNFDGITGKVHFGDKPLFNVTVSETMKEKVFTINELRKEAGLPALANGDRLLTEPSTVAAAPIIQDETVKKKSSPHSRKLTEEDYELVKDLGASHDDFDIIGETTDHSRIQFNTEEDIAKYVIENDIKGLTLSELNELLKKDTGLKLSEKALKDVLTKLNESGVVKVEYDDDNRVKVTPNTTADLPDTDKVFVMYRYVKRPEVTGGDLVPNSRSFCVKLIENNRLYTRAEIQSMGAIFGYDIYRNAGGFYYNSDKDETTPYCRHKWQALSVKRRAK